MRRAAILVLDGLGAGPAHDTAAYGDEGSDTLGNVARAVGGLDLPYLTALGLGRCGDFEGVSPVNDPLAATGWCQPAGAGKDSTTGHWELCGLVLEEPFPTFPNGFPISLLDAFSRETGRGWLGNVAGSGTQLIQEYGLEHLQTGKWIIYTSADSVFQVAAHEDVVPLEELYRACELARKMLVPPNEVSRVIARPFRGDEDGWVRTSDRKDFSLEPTHETLLDRLADRGLPRIGVGKVDDLFAGRGITSVHTATNQEAYDLIRASLETMESGLLLANVIEFDQTWGHRNDVAGFVAGLQELDEALPGILEPVREEDLIIITADHGNDPTTPSTDHSRERVPLLVYGPQVRPVDLGERATFSDVGQTVAEFLGVGSLEHGTSFLEHIWRG
ncbi:MAG: phosphopentomutase [Gemmatimonadales bacterium]